MIVHWSRPASGILAVALLALFLWLDHAYKVTDSFPLKQHTLQPFTVFLMLGTVCYPFGAATLLMALRGWWLAAQSPSWPTAAGTVLRSEVYTRLGKGPRQELDIRYEYTVEGRRYESDQVLFAQRAYWFRTNAEAVTERFPVGAHPGVRYDPDEPGIAVLDTSTDRATGAIWGGIAFLLAPLLGFSQQFRDLVSG
jgi:hypothetical protein